MLERHLRLLNQLGGHLKLTGFKPKFSAVTIVVIILVVLIISYYLNVAKISWWFKRFSNNTITLISLILFGLNVAYYLFGSEKNTAAAAAEPFPSLKYSRSTNKRCVTQLTKKIVAAKQEWKCGQCGKLLDETYEVDHIVPLYLGGTNEESNLMALDPSCHKKKTLSQMAESGGRTAPLKSPG